MEGTNGCHPVLDHFRGAGADRAFNPEIEVGMIAATVFRNRKVAVFGLGRSGVAVSRALLAGGAEVFAYDDNEQAVSGARRDGLPVSDLRVLDFGQLDALVLSPGVPLTNPEPHWTVKKAKDSSVEVIGDTEVFVRQIRDTGARIIAITGTNGKSTTTALTGHVLRSAGLDAETGGNIGTAVFLLGAPGPGKIYVLEFSSYQLDLTPGLAADVAVLLNLSPDHIDRHGSMENYAAVKARVFAGQGRGDVAVISADDRWCRGIAGNINTGAQLLRMSVDQPVGDHADISAVGGILRAQGDVIDLTLMRGLRGRHNWQNACAAYGAGKALGLDAKAIEHGLRSFGGLVHRMEEIGRIAHVIFVNDSKATNADACGRALASFDNIYWIAGGLAKDGGIEPLRPLFKHVRKAYLIGEAAEDFAVSLSGAVAHELCSTLDVAVDAAARDALASKAGEAVVLLSPACASFDQYPSFDVRGDAFCKLVSRLDGIELTKGVAA